MVVYYGGTTDEKPNLNHLRLLSEVVRSLYQLRTNDDFYDQPDRIIPTNTEGRLQSYK